jgi:phosphatidylinositol 4-phosphatase
MRIYGIVGIARLLRGPYLVVITEREEVGKVRGHKVWQVTGTKIIPFREFAPMDQIQEEDEERYLEMLRLVLSLPGIYFSYTYDITQAAQRIAAFSAPDLQKPLWQRADKRFFWNRFLSEPLIQAGDSCPQVHGFILPLMIGYCGIGTVNFDKANHKIDFILLSRRNVSRAGTRFWVRGVDENGNAANNCETEQILVYQSGEMSSFVQTRGSIPVQWTQYVNMTWAPKPVISDDSFAAFSAHFNEQVRIYGEPQLIVNLANQHGSEGRLVEAYGLNAQKFGRQLQYVAFDFHKECPKTNWGRLAYLLQSVAKHVDEIGCFDLKDGNKQVQKQQGTIRTNCIDNLDRTNVVQAMFARAFLLKQLQVMGIMKPGDGIESHPELDSILRNMWADNADFISKQYASAGALKTDFTRTGKRSVFGYVQDGINAIQRYVFNNFYDGFKQDSLNLFVGTFRIKQSSASEVYSSPFPRQRDVQRTTAIAMLSGLVLLLVASTAFSPLGMRSSTYFPFWILPQAIVLFWLCLLIFHYFCSPGPARFRSVGASWNFKFVIAAVWGSAIAAGQLYVKKYGSKLVNKPHLIPPPAIKPKED